MKNDKKLSRAPHIPDKINQDTGWADAIETEIDSSLKRLKCFQFLAPDTQPDETCHCHDLIMTFEVKADGRKKAWHCAGGHKVALRGMSLESTVAKQVSVWLMDITIDHIKKSAPATKKRS